MGAPEYLYGFLGFKFAALQEQYGKNYQGEGAQPKLIPIRRAG